MHYLVRKWICQIKEQSLQNIDMLHSTIGVSGQSLRDENNLESMLGHFANGMDKMSQHPTCPKLWHTKATTHSSCPSSLLLCNRLQNHFSTIAILVVLVRPTSNMEGRKYPVSQS